MLKNQVIKTNKKSTKNKAEYFSWTDNKWVFPGVLVVAYWASN